MKNTDEAYVPRRPFLLTEVRTEAFKLAELIIMANVKYEDVEKPRM